MSTGTTQGMTAAAIAAAVRGTLLGDPMLVVHRVAPLDRARDAEVTFFGSSKYAGAFAVSTAAVVLVSPELAELPTTCRALVIVEKPAEAMLELLPLLYVAPSHTPGIHATAIIDPSARLGAGVCVDPYAVIGAEAEIGDGVWIGTHTVVGRNVVIGAQCQLHPQVTLCDDVRLGARTVVHSGARIGGDGYGYIFRGGIHEKILQVGGCFIGNDVEIGSNCTIDRGSIDDTVIGDGTKIDNLAQIGHNVRVGRLCLVMAQVGIAGSVRVEDGVLLAGQAGIAGHVTIGARARVAAQGGVISDVPPNETWSGYPARPHREALRATAALLKLPALMRRLERLLDTDGA